MTTTNGTRALRACAPAAAVLLGSFLNLRATAEAIEQQSPRICCWCAAARSTRPPMKTCSGAGALCDLLWPKYGGGAVADSAHIARRLFRLEQNDLLAAVAQSRNGRRLMAHPDLREDVPFCLQRDLFRLVAELGKDGAVRAQSPAKSTQTSGGQQPRSLMAPGLPASRVQLLARFRVIRFKPQRLLELGHGFLALALSEQRHAEVEIGFGIIGVQAQRLPVLPNRLFQLPLLRQRIAQIIVRLGILRLQPQRLPILPDGLVQFVLHGEGVAQVAVGAGVLGIGTDGGRKCGTASSSLPCMARAMPRLLWASA